jgi:DNA-damage-inducible protein J
MNMATTIQVRVDDEMKSAAESLFDKLGLDISTAVRMFLSASLRCSGIPFEPRLQYDAETIEAMEDARLGRNLFGPYNSVDEMMESLLSGDEDGIDAEG